MYKDTYSKVTTPDGETETFQITKGVLQGDILAPFLFVITLYYAMRKAIDGREAEFGLKIIQRQGRRHPAIQLTDINYPDIICTTRNRTSSATINIH